MDEHLSTPMRATLLSAATELRAAGCFALAAAPASDMDEPKTRMIWETIVRALGVVRQGGPNTGAVLAETDYPEARVSALLTARGDALVGLIAEAVRWLVTHDVERCTLTEIVALCIA